WGSWSCSGSSASVFGSPPTSPSPISTLGNGGRPYEQSSALHSTVEAGPQQPEDRDGCGETAVLRPGDRRQPLAVGDRLEGPGTSLRAGDRIRPHDRPPFGAFGDALAGNGLARAGRDLDVHAGSPIQCRGRRGGRARQRCRVPRPG